MEAFDRSWPGLSGQGQFVGMGARSRPSRGPRRLDRADEVLACPRAHLLRGPAEVLDDTATAAGIYTTSYAWRAPWRASAGHARIGYVAGLLGEYTALAAAGASPLRTASAGAPRQVCDAGAAAPDGRHPRPTIRVADADGDVWMANLAPGRGDRRESGLDALATERRQARPALAVSVACHASCRRPPAPGRALEDPHRPRHSPVVSTLPPGHRRPRRDRKTSSMPASYVRWTDSVAHGRCARDPQVGPRQ